MLQDIRKSSQGTAAKIIIGLIVISFAAFGIESILLGGGGSSVAEVNGEEITPQELQQAIITQQRRLASMMGENLDPTLLDEDRLRGPALESLVGTKLLSQSAQSMNMAISESEIGGLVSNMQQFQVEGEFSPELYKQVLSDNGYTPGLFKSTLRNDMMQNQVRAGLAGSDFATPAELALNARIVAEQRDFRYLTVPGERFREQQAVPADEDVQAWYESNEARYQTPESVDLEYLELTADAFRAPVDENLLQEAFEQALRDYQASTENRVSHILFTDSGDERIAQAQSRLAAGEDFADLAGEYSEDAGSAARGGDLGYSSGDAFPAEMEEAIAALQLGEVSAPVETDAGVHLILLTERRENAAPSMDELRPQLQESLQLEEARAELLRTVETLRDLSFNAETLDEPARELDLEVAQAAGVTRTQAEGLFANPALSAAAFSEEVLDAGHNSEVIELSGDHFVVLRVARHNAPRTRPLDELRDEIVAELNEQRVREAVSEAADEVLGRLRGGEDIDVVAADSGYEYQVELAAGRRNFNVAPDVLRRVFELPAPDEDSEVSDMLLTSGGDAVVIEVFRVQAGAFDAMPETEQAQLQQQVTGEYGSLVDSEYRQGLRSTADISVM